MPLIASINAILARFSGNAIAFVYHRWSASWSVDKAEISRLEELSSAGEGVILVFWHGKFLPLFALLEGQHAVVFTSDGFRGAVIAQICQRFGHVPSILPPGGQGAAYRHMIRETRHGKTIAFATDGPLGPHRQAKPGAVRMASQLGFLILPVSAESQPARVMEKRWDKRVWPHWGATVTLRTGDPIRIPAGLKGDAVRKWTAIVTQAIDANEHRK
ncbi:MULTISPECIES: lysophospholipid acyltransferase family protein [Frigidibacter]|uniref:DUF374 domain-containing protein n=1 Tax=Frigidibacter mobilis TaxID=1335048 RepID=A0A159Z3R6_9RHOB|nr:MULTISPECIES: DUF374 domain-containing protein [Frigidibacter]AMY69787.1 hypothetical protein AKL17_2544 [Frigidibacter mobilis]MDP3340443.1 DUF374 domain-containing protein [Frigidibacter sp.]